MEKIDKILKKSKNIAVIGLSPDESKVSNMIARYLIKEEFVIFPVYPKCDEILGRKVYRALSEICEPVDIAVMFRKGEYGLPLVNEAIQSGAKCVWLQLGITNNKAEQVANNAGLDFVQDRCIMIELERLKGKN